MINFSFGNRASSFPPGVFRRRPRNHRHDIDAVAIWLIVVDDTVNESVADDDVVGRRSLAIVTDGVAQAGGNYMLAV